MDCLNNSVCVCVCLWVGGMFIFMTRCLFVKMSFLIFRQSHLFFLHVFYACEALWISMCNIGPYKYISVELIAIEWNL